jgi:hypothetical protein
MEKSNNCNGTASNSGSEVQVEKLSYWARFKKFIIHNFTIYSELEPMLKKIETVERHMLEIRQELEVEIELVTRDLDMYKSILDIMTRELPDMFWLKLQDGRYTIANKTIKDKLLLDDNPIGKTDIQLALAAKEKYGDENHTFGEKCSNSDAVVTETMNKQRFLESGKVKGKMLYLEVYKAPLVINGEFVGVFGSGRDMTEYVEAYIEQRELMEKYAPGITTKLDNIFSKYSFQSHI